ncbi:hypothetical protein Tco_1311389 [Tanacetum coccineum]
MFIKSVICFNVFSVKSLALSLEIVELLSTSEEAISHQHSPFTSLKSLKIYPLEGLKTLTSHNLETYPLRSSLDMFPTQLNEEQEAMKIKLSAEVTNYLLDSSSNATFTMSRKTLADSCREDFRMRIGPRGDNEVIFCILQNIKLLLTKICFVDGVKVPRFEAPLIALSSIKSASFTRNFSQPATQVKEEEEEIENDQRRLPTDYDPATFDPTEHRSPPTDRVWRLVDEMSSLTLAEVAELPSIMMKKMGMEPPVIA